MPNRSLLRRLALLTALAAIPLWSLAPALAAGPLSLSTTYPAVVVAAGARVNFEIDVIAGANQRVALSLSGVPDGWTATIRGGGFVIDAIQTDAEGQATFRVDVDVPGGTPAGTTRITLAGSGGGQQASLPLDIRVSDEAAGTVTVTTDFPSLRGPSDTTFTFNLTLHNDTSEDQTFAVTAVGPDGWDVSATLTGQSQAASAVVEAGGTSAISVSATPPEQIDAGTYAIQVRASVGAQTFDAALEVEITGTNRLTMETPDGLLSNHGTAGGTISQQLVIYNEGTATLTDITISATTPRDWTVTYDPSETVASVEPGASATVTASIVPSNDAIAGDYEVTFRAQGAQVSDALAIRVTIETSALWGFVGVGLIGAILVGLWWVFRTYGRR